ncbi:hypothetical protein [Peribacillus muralis]|nr:hypothetical protein [Peribacillus muralis]
MDPILVFNYGEMLNRNYVIHVVLDKMRLLQLRRALASIDGSGVI